MMKKTLLALSAAVLLGATGQVAAAEQAPPVPASGAATPPPSTAAPAKPAKKAHDPNEVICKTQPEPGSRLGGKKVCATRESWDEQAAAMSDSMRVNSHPIGH